MIEIAFKMSMKGCKIEIKGSLELNINRWSSDIGPSDIGSFDQDLRVPLNHGEARKEEPKKTRIAVTQNGGVIR